LGTKPKDRDFIETTDGLIFCVVGYLHPVDGYTAYLKYIPSKDGKWERDGTRYTRSIPYYQVSQVENTYDWLKKTHPEHILQCPVRNIEVSWVPANKVKTYYRPRERLNNINQNGLNDSLEEKLLRLVELLEETAGVIGSIGVTGSILTRTHNPAFSDIDLTVYGLTESYRLMEALQELKRAGVIRDVSTQAKKQWVQSKSNRHGLSTDDLMRIAEKRWNYGYFEDTYFSVHPTRLDKEITETYGENTYHRISVTSGTATITNYSESIFLPALYKIQDSEPEIKEIVSFEGLYGSLFENGDKIEYKGILEKVEGKNPHHRIIVGGAGSPDSYITWSYSG